MKKIQCGGFYVDDGAIETREGKPFLKTGGSDPIVENAKQTGGFGYTEQGEQTVVVDNESVTTADSDGMICGLFATPFDIVDGSYTVIFNGTEYNLNSAFHEKAGFWYLGDASKNSPDFSRYPFMIASIDRGALKKAVFKRTELYTESAGDYEITIKITTEAIHKIDEKYLPESEIDPDDVEYAVETASNAWNLAYNASENANSAQTIANEALEKAEQAEQLSITPTDKNMLSVICSQNAQMKGWYGFWPSLYYNKTSGHFSKSAFTSNTPIPVNELPKHFIIDDFASLDGSGPVHYVAQISLIVYGTENKYAFLGTAITNAGLIFKVSSNKVDPTSTTGIILVFDAPDHITLKSSTTGSTKLFKIRVNDSGEISATEIAQ